MPRRSRPAGRAPPSHLKQQTKDLSSVAKDMNISNRAPKRKTRESSEDESSTGNENTWNPANASDTENSASLEDESEDEFAGDRARAARWVDEDELDDHSSDTHESSSGDEAPSVKGLVGVILRSRIVQRCSQTSVLRCNVAVNQTRHATSITHRLLDAQPQLSVTDLSSLPFGALAKARRALLGDGARTQTHEGDDRSGNESGSISDTSNSMGQSRTLAGDETHGLNDQGPKSRRVIEKRAHKHAYVSSSAILFLRWSLISEIQPDGNFIETCRHPAASCCRGPENSEAPLFCFLSC